MGAPDDHRHRGRVPHRAAHPFDARTAGGRTSR